ncbi:MAG: hydroxyacid dehydrogenase [Candidatus Eisenbacteria bacterium]
MRILVTDAVDADALARLAAAGHPVIERPGVQGDALVEALEGCGALLVRGGTKVTAEVLRRAASLRVVVRAGTGLDNVDAAAAAERGIVVRNTPGANRVSVAELVFALLLEFERHVGEAAAALRAGRWEKSRFAGRELAGRVLGLVGFGRIGREVATRARAFEMTVRAFDPLLAAWPDGYDWVDRRMLDALLAESDVVSLHVPLDPGTRAMIGARELERMKPGALLVNAARGGVVDETALLEGLRRGRPRGAMIDVFASEPATGHPLVGLPNVIATPHLGASTAEAQTRAGDEAAAVLLEAIAAIDARS